MPCEPGRARQLGEMNSRGTGGGSWHYAVDPLATFQCSYDRYICWHAPPNGHSIGIEMADNPSRLPGRWTGRRHAAMLRRTARLTAHLCLYYNLPMVWLSPADLRAGKRGVTSHNNVSSAWHQSSHWDPGSFPTARFMKMVRTYAAEIKESAR
jgi:hypothetical protein